MEQNMVFQNKLNENLNRFRNRIAIECGDRFISYRQLETRASAVTGWLTDNGFVKDTFVGLCIRDSVEFITALIGTINAGCVFVPLDTSFPLPGLRMMIDIARPSLVVCDDAGRTPLHPPPHPPSHRPATPPPDTHPTYSPARAPPPRT
ncbi:MAG: amino acid adenylation domain-containing protein, partial [bacterium]|nr:amino acid adenylation domain-containing protein [bacterium]